MRMVQSDNRVFAPHPRKGLSLAEVLIAMFVLAIGMMGILALFPLGAAQMAQAVKDERAAQLADLSEGHARIMWRAAWLNTDGTLATDQQAFANEPALMALDDPTAPVTYAGAMPPGYAAAVILNEPSSPLYIDPVGFTYSSTAQGKKWVPNSGAWTVLPRRSLKAIEDLQIAGAGAMTAARIRIFGLLDDMSFNQQGNASPVNRAGRYNAAYLLQRPKNNVRQEVNLKVVVYAGRAPAPEPAAPARVGGIVLTWSASTL